MCIDLWWEMDETNSNEIKKTQVSIFGKELLKIKFYGRMKKYLKSFPFYWKGGVMGKSLNGKELGKGCGEAD